MIKVFEDFELSRVGHMQSLLESHGIRTHLRNQFSSSVLGELPFVEVIPQLFVLEDKDAERARELLSFESRQSSAGKPWVCAPCGSDVDGELSCCWNCEAPAPAT